MLQLILLPWPVFLFNVSLKFFFIHILMQDSSGSGLLQRKMHLEDDDFSRAISLSLKVFQILSLRLLFVLSLYLRSLVSKTN